MGSRFFFWLGGYYVNSLRLRINAFSSKAETAGGRKEYCFCRTGCGTVEIQNHIMQQCHRTYDARIRRHDSVAHCVTKVIRYQTCNVTEEPKYKTSKGVRKPDNKASKQSKAFILDVQVISDKYGLDCPSLSVQTDGTD
ncbi:hypothetical protein GWI33_015945 [Rhynchophorus ferrugineus]|uniref:Uncharacterized protein n=1 Tax=Rhynchophorus ferrugineus TaxID=354439 RepID=A0A834MAT9_RHYFE|nr:hypothetical protein GWI33_015945 [Rhynchophorus ferrugineus]